MMKKCLALLLILICCLTTGCSRNIDCLGAREQSAKFVKDYLSCGTNATYQQMLKKYNKTLEPELYAKMLKVPDSCLGSLETGSKDHEASITNIIVYSKDTDGDLKVLGLEDSADLYQCELDALLIFRGVTAFEYKITVTLDRSGKIQDFVIDFLEN